MLVRFKSMMNEIMQIVARKILLQKKLNSEALKEI